MNTLINDIKFAFRRLLNNPCFTIVAVLTLALGIGANTAIFSTIDAVLLQPLPYAESQQLVMMNETLPDGRHNGNVSGGAFLDWKSHTKSLEHVAYFKYVEFNLTGIDQPERVRGREVTADFLRVLRVDPIVGRGFAPDEDQMGSDNQVVVLNHAYWKSRFGSDPEVVGRVISLDQKPYTIIGVLPPDRIMENDVSLLVPVVIQVRKVQSQLLRFHTFRNQHKPFAHYPTLISDQVSQFSIGAGRNKQKWGSLPENQILFVSGREI